MRRVFPLLLLLALLLAGCQGEAAPAVSYDLDQVPAYAGEPYVVINDNQPFFGEEEYTTEAFETYSALDGLGDGVPRAAAEPGPGGVRPHPGGCGGPPAVDESGHAPAV